MMTDLQKIRILKSFIKTEYKVDLTEHTRNREVIGLLWSYCNVAKKYTKLTLRIIGEQVKRDHATVLHHCRREPRPEWLDRYEEIEQAIQDVNRFVKYRRDERAKEMFIHLIINQRSQIRKLQKEENDDIKNELLRNLNKLNRTRKKDLIYKSQILVKVQDKFKAA